MRNVYIAIIIILGLTACENQEQTFPDFDYKTVYFPIQLPVRTLSLGEDRVDNTLDKEYKFDIGVSIGGMYENNQEWMVDYVVDPALAEKVVKVVDNISDTLYALPSGYYTLSPVNTAIIPSGSFNGLIRVELTDQFFNDNFAVTGQYVVPLRITGTSADSVLSGKPISQDNADRRVVSDWESGKAPKDWTLYAIKYVNAYHGTYLYRGMNITLSGGVPVDTIVYREDYVENDMLTTLTTMDLFTAKTNRISNSRASPTGRYAMELEFGNSTGASGTISIKPSAGSNWAANGTGEYFDLSSSSESWTGLVWQSMYLDYSYNDGTNDHQVYDTLVFRDRGIRYEENIIRIIP